VLGYRIHWNKDLWSDTYGASKYGGRWNPIGVGVIYAAENYSLAVLETLVHAGRTTMPTNKAATEILIPFGVDVTAPKELLALSSEEQMSYGREWYRLGGSAVLRVPSHVVRGREFNLVINPDHPDFKKLRASEPLPVEYDPRLFVTSKP
jgi:RES domain-containing protein